MRRTQRTLLPLASIVIIAACGPSASNTQGEIGPRDLAKTAVHQALDGGAFEALLEQAIASAFGAAKSRIEGSGRQFTVAQTQQLETAIRNVFTEVYPRQAWEEVLLPLYLNGFDQEELEEINRFQQTALGRKLAVVQARVATGGGSIGQQFIQSRQAEFTRRLGEQLAAVWGAGAGK
ncbi:MAG: hypothetical protein HOP28_07910 [Gemmatimonadales bacterium]|nr:hypothetical protein [Gemmatimonadales bacterium]